MLFCQPGSERALSHAARFQPMLTINNKFGAKQEKPPDLLFWRLFLLP
jgi:hypothetical protein